MKRIGYLSLLMTIGFIFQFSPARALDTDIDVAIGYDDNPAEVSDTDGSGFTRYHVQLAQSFFKEAKGLDVDTFFDIAYQQYFDLEDNYRLLAGAALDIDSGSDRFLPGLFAEVAAFRDDLVADDERDALLLGGFVQWLVDARVTLTLRQSFSWDGYRNRVSLPGQRSNTVKRRKGHGNHQQLPVDEPITFSRDDDIRSTEMSATYHFSADVQVDLAFQYRDVASSADFETFQEQGGSARIGWFYPMGGEIFLSGFWSKLDYEEAPESIDRSDDFYGVSAGANRTMGNITFYLQFDQTVNDSPVDGENYEKAVVQCGGIYSF